MSNYRVNKLHRLLCCWHVCHLHEEVAEEHKRKFSASDARGVIKINKTTSWIRKRKINKIKHRIKGEVQSKSEWHRFCVNKKILDRKTMRKFNAFPQRFSTKSSLSSSRRSISMTSWKVSFATPTTSLLITLFALVMLWRQLTGKSNKRNDKKFFACFETLLGILHAWEKLTKEKIK